MFTGATPTKVVAAIADRVRGWDGPIAVGCSGSFRIERAVRAVGCQGPITSNDVNLYSCALGAYYAGQDFPVSVASDHLDRIGWLDPWLRGGGAGQVATILLASSMLDNGGGARWSKHLLTAYRDQWSTLHAKTVATLEKGRVELAEFHAGDVVPWVDQLPASSLIILTPPSYSGGYERLFRNLETMLVWPQPDYETLTMHRLNAFLTEVAARPHWVVSVQHPVPSLGEPAAIVEHGAMGFWVYSSRPGRALVYRRSKVPALLNVPVLGYADRPEGPLRVVKVPTAYAEAVRERYLAPGILGGQGSLGLAVYAGELLIGAALWRRPPSSHGPGAYILCDVAVPSARHLSRLVAAALFTEEARRLVESTYESRIAYITTTAYGRPSSMKYRGLMKPGARKRHSKGWAVSYRGGWSGRLCEEVLEEWQTKNP